MLNEISGSVLVFRTNIQDERDLTKVADVFNREPGIRRWNVDQDDVDYVLRIESEQLMPENVMLLVRQAGFECEELPE